MMPLHFKVDEKAFFFHGFDMLFVIAFYLEVILNPLRKVRIHGFSTLLPLTPKGEVVEINGF